MTSELWICLGLVVLLVIVISQNMDLRDKMKRLEARLDGSTVEPISRARSS